MKVGKKRVTTDAINGLLAIFTITKLKGRIMGTNPACAGHIAENHLRTVDNVAIESEKCFS